MFKQFNPMQYLAIDIANHYGLDKKNYEDRIEWVKTNEKYLEDFENQAEEPVLFHKAVNALRKVQSGKPVGHAVALDSASSGLQIMSAVMRCKDGASMTGLIDPDNRVDAYTIITERMNEKLNGKVQVTRKDAKRAIMTFLYGSEAVPEEVFPEPDVLNCFYAVIEEYCNGAYTLLNILLNSWDSKAKHYAWYMPDGHYVYIPVMKSVTTRVELTDWGYKPNAIINENLPVKFAKANPANAIHSIDAYILRTMVRRCNYNKPKVKEVMQTLKSSQDLEVNENLALVKRYRLTAMADITELDTIKENADYLPPELKDKLVSIFESMLKHEPFDIITIHDSFACHANHCNQMRFHYKEILAELSESTVIDDICSQIYGFRDTIDKGESIAKYIRNSNYAIC